MTRDVVNGVLVVKRDPRYERRNWWWRETEARGDPYIWMKEGRVNDIVEMDLFHHRGRPTLEAVREAIGAVDKRSRRRCRFRTEGRRRGLLAFTEKQSCT